MQFLTRIKQACRQAAQETARGATPVRLGHLCFVFDRGFAKDKLFQFLSREGFTFIVRANTNVRCLSPKGRSMLLAK